MVHGHQMENYNMQELPHKRCVYEQGSIGQEEPILVLTRREGTDFVLTLDSLVHLWYLRYLRTCDTCVPTCVTLTA